MQTVSVQVADVIRLMTHDDLYVYKRQNSNAALGELLAYDKEMQHVKKGVVFVSPSKENLTEGKGYIVTSYETLERQVNDLSHWTPNTFRGGTYYDFKKRIIKGHTRDNLKQINVIGFDIDTKEVDLYGLFLGCEERGLPRPNLLLETPHGFQGFFILETPFYIHKNNDYKALRVAERLANNILDALHSYIPIDRNCSPFGFYRIPNNENIIHFNEEPANTALLLEWSKAFEKEEKKKQFQVIYGGKDIQATNYTTSDWYRALLQTRTIREGEYASSRNNALLTLALANYADGITFEGAYDVLDQFNSNLVHPLSKSEFERTIKSAYSGKYKGVQRSYVESLLENWTDGEAKFQGKNGWYKFKKPREERERSHYWEWHEDIQQFLKQHISPEMPFFTGSLRMLAKLIKIPLSTLKKVLKESKIILTKTEGKGRAAKTHFTTRDIWIRNIIATRKDQDVPEQMVFGELLSEEDRMRENPAAMEEIYSEMYPNTS